MTETSFILNTFFILFCGCLVMFMALGFAMLEAGSVRSKSVGVILIKNIGLYAIASIMFFLIGYNLMYLNVDGGFIGTLATWVPDDKAAMSGDYSAGYASSAGWFFQMVFVATAASIVSGALAERIKIWPFFFFCIILTSILYPIVGAWT
ncbi:MAG TPA: ammonium transporter, partial [Alphaproteobacteria bacterium]|nr:ammonium transporter [Alphaproteobacteria bacterium]